MRGKLLLLDIELSGITMPLLNVCAAVQVLLLPKLSDATTGPDVGDIVRVLSLFVTLETPAAPPEIRKLVLVPFPPQYAKIIVFVDVVEAIPLGSADTSFPELDAYPGSATLVSNGAAIFAPCTPNATAHSAPVAGEGNLTVITSPERVDADVAYAS